MNTWSSAISLVGLLSSVAVYAETRTPAAVSVDPNAYRIVYGATLDPVGHRAEVRIAVRQPRQLLRHIEFAAPRDRYLDVHGQG